MRHPLSTTGSGAPQPPGQTSAPLRAAASRRRDQASTGLAHQPIGPWAGLGVLTAWAGAALLAGALVLRARDA
jgi:hypothetical protein